MSLAIAREFEFESFFLVAASRELESRTWGGNEFERTTDERCETCDVAYTEESSDSHHSQSCTSYPAQLVESESVFGISQVNMYPLEIS